MRRPFFYKLVMALILLMPTLTYAQQRVSCGSLPALTGDTTTQGGSCQTTTQGINGTLVPVNTASDQLLLTTAPLTGAWGQLVNCGDSGHALAYSTSTHTFSCQAISATGSTAWSSLSSGANSNVGTFSASGNSWDFTASSVFKLRVGAGLTTSANGDVGYDSTGKIWHIWQNGADKLSIVASNLGVSGQPCLSNADGSCTFADPIVSGPDNPGVAPTRNPVQVSGVNGAGNVTRILTDNSGNTSVVFPSAQPVSGTVAVSGSVTIAPPTGASATQVQGTAANAGLTVGNPIWICGTNGGKCTALATDASGNLTVVGAGTAGTPSGGVVTVQGVVGGTPVIMSGTVTANAGSGTFTVSGTVTANQGGAPWTQRIQDGVGSTLATVTGANALKVDNSSVTQPISASSLPLPTGAAADSSVNGVIIPQGSTTSGEKGPLIQAAVTTGAPTYTTAQTDPLSLDTSGNLRTSVNNTVTISGTVTTTPPSNASTNVAQFGGTNVVTGTGTGGAGIPRVTVSSDSFPATQTVSGTVTANVGTTNGLALDATVNKLNSAQSSTTSGETGPLAQGAVTTTAPTYTTAQTSPLSLTTAGALRTDASATTQPVSGTVTANAGTGTFAISGTVTANAGTNLNTSALALDTSVNGLLQSQGSTTSGQKGTLEQGAVTTGAPTYTTGQTSPLSLDTSGNLRASVNNTVTVSGTVITTPPSNASTNVAQFGGNNVITGTGASGVGIPRVTISNDSSLAANQSVNVNQVAGASTGATNPLYTAIADGTTGPVAVKAASTSAAAADKSLVVQLSPNQPNLASALNVTGTVTANQGGAPWSQNLTQVNSVSLGSPSAYGTSPGAVNVSGVNAFITNTPSVSGSGTFQTQSNGNSTFLAGQQTVTTIATPLPTNNARTVYVTASSKNGESVFIGGSTVTPTTGQELTAGSMVVVPVNNSNLIYVVGLSTGEVITWSASN